jgi:hypothetical protein
MCIFIDQLHVVVVGVPQIWRQTGSVSEYFASAWNYIDLISIAASLISIAIWTYIAYYSAFVFDIELTYDVYTEPPHKWYRPTDTPLGGCGYGQCEKRRSVHLYVLC